MSDLRLAAVNGVFMAVIAVAGAVLSLMPPDWTPIKVGVFVAFVLAVLGACLVPIELAKRAEAIAITTKEETANTRMALDFIRDQILVIQTAKPIKAQPNANITMPTDPEILARETERANEMVAELENFIAAARKELWRGWPKE